MLIMAGGNGNRGAANGKTAGAHRRRDGTRTGSVQPRRARRPKRL